MSSTHKVVKKSNPLAKAGWIVLIAGFAFLGVTFLTSLKESLEPYVSLVVFFCSCFTLVWLYFQIQTGEISMVSQTGVYSKHSREKEPVAFFVVCGFYGLIALSLVILLGSDIFLGCEGSLINPC